MHAIRSLPLINRPSRAPSPAPTATQATATGIVHPPPSDGIVEAKPRSRSLSRQVADKFAASHTQPLSTTNSAAPSPNNTSSATLGIGKKGNSPPESRAGTPRSTASPLPPAIPHTDVLHKGNMDVIGLRLNDVVNKTCIGIDYKTKRGFRKGAGWALGESVVQEIPLPPADPYLTRAILRTIVRALSIYVSRLESLLLPILTDSTFNASLSLTNGGGPHAQPLNSTQTFAVSVAHAAWETCEKLEQALETTQYPRFVEDALRPTMDKFDLIVGKVVKPILLLLKNDLEASLHRVEQLSPKPSSVSTVPVPSQTGGVVPLSREHSQQPGSRLAKETSGPGHSRQLAVPPCLQAFAARVDGGHRVLELVAAPCQHDGEGWSAKVIVAVVWNGLRMLADKDIGELNRPPSPGSLARALAGLSKDKDAVSSAVSSAPLPPAPAPSSITGVTAKLSSTLNILPSRTQSRPSSPPRRGQGIDPTTLAVVSLEALFKRLVAGLVQPPTALAGATNAEDQQAEHIAREALAEALEALMSFRIVCAAMHAPTGAGTRILASVRRLRDDIDEAAEEALDDAVEDLPSVILFSVMLRRANVAITNLVPPLQISQPQQIGADGFNVPLLPLRIRTPWELWGWTHADFERQVLSGFGPAEEWGPRVATAIKPEVERVLAILVAEEASGPERKDLVEPMQWVKALGVALEARAGIKVSGAI